MSDQSDTAQPVGKILQGEAGLGTVTPEMVSQRALELARIDGRTEAHEGDRLAAQQELLGPADESSGPEADSGNLDEVVAWDEAPGVLGTQATEIVPDDESSVAVTLIQEGLEEADHDQRLTAAQSDPPDSEL